jgi:hypothetical protein
MAIAGARRPIVASRWLCVPFAGGSRGEVGLDREYAAGSPKGTEIMYARGGATYGAPASCMRAAGPPMGAVIMYARGGATYGRLHHVCARRDHPGGPTSPLRTAR